VPAKSASAQNQAEQIFSGDLWGGYFMTSVRLWELV